MTQSVIFIRVTNVPKTKYIYTTQNNHVRVKTSYRSIYLKRSLTVPEFSEITS